MAVEDAIAAALLVVLSATLTLLAVATFRRYRHRSFLFLTGAFGIALAEGVAISLLVLSVLPGGGLPLSVVAILQVAVLLLIYVATFFRE
jgi:putative flippase GtrA